MTEADSKSDQKMSTEESRVIGTISGYYEFPYAWLSANELALFRTYAIPSISSLLCATGQLTDPEAAGKRAEDTGCFYLKIRNESSKIMSGKWSRKF